MWEKAVVDRIVDGQHAVLLVGEAESEHVIPAKALPEQAREGAWLRVRIESGVLVDFALDAEETEQARQRVRSKLEQLRKRGRTPKESR